MPRNLPALLTEACGSSGPLLAVTWCAIAQRVTVDGEAEIGLAELAIAVGRSVRQLHRYIRALQQVGLIAPFGGSPCHSIRRGLNLPNLYRLTFCARFLGSSLTKPLKMQDRTSVSDQDRTSVSDLDRTSASGPSSIHQHEYQHSISARLSPADLPQAADRRTAKTLSDPTLGPPDDVLWLISALRRFCYAGGDPVEPTPDLVHAIAGVTRRRGSSLAAAVSILNDKHQYLRSRGTSTESRATWPRTPAWFVAVVDRALAAAPR